MDANLLTATSACAGAAAGALALALNRARPSEDERPADRRLDALRKKSSVFRNYESAVAILAVALRRVAGGTMGRVGAALEIVCEEDWRPEEYVATKVVGTLPVVAVLGFAALVFSGPLQGFLVVAVLLLVMPWLVVRSARTRAAVRVKRIRGRLPSTLDLMALVLEAGGGTLYDCLRLGASENGGHPLGEEYRRVVLGAEKGSPPTELLADMSRRLGDPDVAEVNLAICTSEIRGLPLKESLRAVAARMRQRQVQWLEKASEQAKVHITWPTMLVMLGCLLIVVAPLVIEALSAGR